MEKTIWKAVKGWEGFYEVSNDGQVRSISGKRSKVNKLLKLGICRGYANVSLSKNNKVKTFIVHRLVAIAFIPNPNNYPEVNHIDGNTLNNNLENLEWCSRNQNVAHALKNRLYAHGVKSRSVKLTPEQVIFIRENYSLRAMTATELANKFNTSKQAIYYIISKRNWKYI